jgi:hypothetical protein
MIGRINRGMIAREYNFVDMAGVFIAGFKRDLLIIPEAKDKKIIKLWIYNKDKKLLGYIGEI